MNTTLLKRLIVPVLSILVIMSPSLGLDFSETDSGTAADNITNILGSVGVLWTLFQKSIME